MRRRSKLAVRAAMAALAVALVSTAVVAAPAGAGVRRAAGGAAIHLVDNQVTIIRDSAGIPHITAGNFFALGYGEAYAFSQDNFCTLAQDFVTVNGERSRYFGPSGPAVNFSAGTQTSNLQSDFFWQSVKDSGLYRARVPAAPPIGPLPQVTSVYSGFVAGYNAYLKSGKLRDPACAHKAWVRPISLEDMFLRGVQIATENSSAQFVGYEALAAPPSPGKSAVRTAREPIDHAALRALRESGASSGGSNGIGVGSKDTQAGDGLVLANPHFPWQGTERFWMAQLRVPGSYDVEGGTLEGFPEIGIGFNQHLAWTHTVSTSYRFTLYQLKLVPGHPTSYLVDGKARAMGRATVHVPLAHGTATHTFYTTRWGTVTDLPPAGLAWSATTAYALDDANIADEYRAADQYFKMGQATTVEGLLRTELSYLAIPSFNTIAADDMGHVLYGDVGNTPNVSTKLIHACLPAGVPTIVYQVAGVVTLDGSRTSCAWGTDSHTPVPGIFNGTHLPHTIRTDYVENSNDSYWLANPSAPFKAYSPIIGDIDVPQGLRTRLGNEMIAARLKGADGLGRAKFTISTMQAMWENDRSLLAELVLHPLVASCRKTTKATASDHQLVDLRAACNVLARYDGTGNLDAAGGWLFSEWARLAVNGPFWADKFNPAHPLTTPSKLDTANPGILQGLADAVLALKSHHLALDTTYGEVQHVDRNRAVIAIHGCDTGCFNAIYANSGPATPSAPVGYGGVYDGSSLVMTTELTRSGPVSQGILTYSQASDPTSPWFANMTRLYSSKHWVPLPYSPAALAAQSGNTTTVLTAP